MRSPTGLTRQGPSKTTRLIGRRCKHGDVLSRPVLIGRGLGFDARARYRVHGVIRGARALRSVRVAGFGRTWRRRFGGHGGGETPGPIPNPEVKPSSADGTALETGWESRSPPRHLRIEPPSGRLYSLYARHGRGPRGESPWREGSMNRVAEGNGVTARWGREEAGGKAAGRGIRT